MIFEVNNLPKSLDLSRERENHIVQYSFDFSAWVEQYGEGIFFIKALRPKEETPYIVPDIMFEGNIATWTVTNSDSGINGIGAIELNYTNDTYHKKSSIIKTVITNALDDDGEVPDTYEDWLAHLAELANSTYENANSAAQSAIEAQEYRVKFDDENQDGNIEIRWGGE